jgi:hypothetical protein
MGRRISGVDEPITDLEGRENLLMYLAFLSQVERELSADTSKRSGSVRRASRMIERAFGKAAKPMQE